MITLYQFAPAWGLPNASPFCMKLETYLRMTGLPYTVAIPALRDLQRAPKGKLPFIEDDGVRIGDSTFIIEHLKARYGDPLDAPLSAAERATALAFQRLLEENLYWAMVYSRWMDAQAWPLTREAFFGALPAPLRWLVPGLARRGMRAQLRGHGMGRHSASEIEAIARRDIVALSDFLADKAFFMGAQPSSLDAVAYAFVANLLESPAPSALTSWARQHANLVAYGQRMKDRYYANP